MPADTRVTPRQAMMEAMLGEGVVTRDAQGWGRVLDHFDAALRDQRARGRAEGIEEAAKEVLREVPVGMHVDGAKVKATVSTTNIMATAMVDLARKDIAARIRALSGAGDGQL